ncbi:MAG: hypothetical protein ACP5TL_02230 [Candidatus Micrarchaeia archaeon]
MGDIEQDAEFCQKCGRRVYSFSKRRAASDGREYCIKCAEEVDRQYLEDYTCSVCKRLIGKSEIKFVLPSSAYNSTDMPMHKRLLCVSCYQRYGRKVHTSHSLLGIMKPASLISKISRQTQHVKPVLTKSK